jgi:hypothetical protein
LLPVGAGAFFALALIGVLLVVAPGSPAKSESVAERRIVVVYYANETSAETSSSQNYRELFDILDNDSGSLSRLVAESISGDVVRFRNLVDRDLNDLIQAASQRRFDLIAFTNDLAAKHEFVAYASDLDQLSYQNLPVLPPAPNVVLATSPLSRPDFLRSALSIVAERYPPDTLDVLLIANSHGSAEMALMPRVNVDLSSSAAKDELKNALRTNDRSSATGLIKLQGTTKVDFWNVLKNVSDGRSVRFPLVFREACGSGIRSWEEYYSIPNSVSLIAHTAMEDFAGESISYANIFRNVKNSRNLVSAVEAGLAQSGVHVNSASWIWGWVVFIEMGALPRFLFFAPVVLWVFWLGATHFRVHSRGSTRFHAKGCV